MEGKRVLERFLHYVCGSIYCVIDAMSTVFLVRVGRFRILVVLGVCV